jgi:hypothetical protein
VRLLFSKKGKARARSGGVPRALPPPDHVILDCDYFAPMDER